jgi:5'-nucleotidase
VSFILVTNDDGADSPALVPLARALAELAPVRVVAPEGERSWVGKAISRWDEIVTRRDEREGVEMTRVSGSPADCANLGVHSLFDTRPEMLVSGVNIGLNTGAAFFLSSGTVGAAMEGWIAGLPALAFSIGVTGDNRNWKADLDGEAWRIRWEHAAAISADIVGTVRALGFPSGVDLLNVNFDIEANITTPRVVTRMAHVGYERLFAHRGDGRFAHEYSGELLTTQSLDGTDVGVVGEGRVSITPVRLLDTASLDDEMRRALERND